MTARNRTGVIKYTYRRPAATRAEVNERYARMLCKSLKETHEATVARHNAIMRAQQLENRK